MEFGTPINGVIWIIAIAILIAGTWAVWWRTRPKLECPECGSQEVGIISKEPQGMRGTNYGGGGAGGGRGSTQLFYDVKYRCNNCGEAWQKVITETS